MKRIVSLRHGRALRSSAWWKLSRWAGREWRGEKTPPGDAAAAAGAAAAVAAVEGYVIYCSYK